ncbi:hypothetical protein EJB05_37749, partial [Eragrostis curvula]
MSSFWGVEVKPGKPYTLTDGDSLGRLRLTQATLGDPVGKGEKGAGGKKCVLQCSVDNKDPVYLCSLVPDQSETCHLELEFEEDVVTFSVNGSRSIHLAGYYIPEECEEGMCGRDADSLEGSDEDDLLESDDDDSEEDGSDYDSETDEEMVYNQRRGKSSVVIEEIQEDDKPAVGGAQKGSNKKHANEMDKSQLQLAVRTPPAESMESEDEDGFPVPIAESKKSPESVSKNTKDTSNEDRKRKSEAISNRGDSSGEVKAENDGASKKKKKAKGKRSTVDNGIVNNEEKEVKQQDSPADANQKKKKNKNTSSSEAVTDQQSAKKNQIHGDAEEVTAQEGSKKKSKKQKTQETNKSDSQAQTGLAESGSRKEPLQTRTFGNGMIIQELEMGKPDGKRATRGKKVSMRYIGKLKNGKIFDSNIGGRPFEFRLGVGEVIKGWDVGVDGMRIGDKRRLTIPPSMGYGNQRVGQIPQNSTLFFDVELVNWTVAASGAPGAHAATASQPAHRFPSAEIQTQCLRHHRLPPCALSSSPSLPPPAPRARTPSNTCTCASAAPRPTRRVSPSPAPARVLHLRRAGCTARTAASARSFTGATSTRRSASWAPPRARPTFPSPTGSSATSAAGAAPPTPRASSRRAGRPPPPATYGALADGYCRAGLLEDARRVVDGMPARVEPTAYAFNPLIHALCDRGRVRDALAVLDDMLSRGCAPDVVTYNILLEAACKGRGYRQAMELIDFMRSEGCEPNNVTYNVIIDAMCREGDVDDAREFLNNLPSKGCKPNTVNYNTVLKGFCGAERWEDANEIVTEMIEENCQPSEATLNVIINALSRKGQLQNVIQLLEKLSKHGCTASVVTYNSIINGFCEQGHVDSALELLSSMQSFGCKPDIITYNTVLKGLCGAERWDDAEELMAKMTENGCFPDNVTFNTMIGFLCQKGLAVQAFEVFKQMSKKGCSPNPITYSTIINGLAKAGKMGQALEVFNGMACKGFSSDKIFQLLTDCLNEEDKIEEAVQIVRKLQDAGTPLNTVLYNTVLLALCRNGKTDYAIDLLSNMVSCGCMPDESTYIILIEGLAYEGFLKEARELLSNLCSRDILRNSLIKNEALLLDQK